MALGEGEDEVERVLVIDDAASGEVDAVGREVRRVAVGGLRRVVPVVPVGEGARQVVARVIEEG